MPPRIADILRRAEAAPLDEIELRELREWMDGAAEAAPLAAALEALAPGEIDVADDVMAALQLDEAFAPLGLALRDAVVADVDSAGLAAIDPGDLADDVMAALHLDAAFEPVGAALRDAVARPADGMGDGMGDIVGDILAAIDAAEAADLREQEISAFADGEVDAAARSEVTRRLLRDPAARATITAQAELGAAIRDAVRGVDPIDVWPAVATAIGAPEVDEEALWAPLGEALRDAVQAPRIDVSAAVMAEVAPPERARAPRWFSLGSPLLVFAAAAALVVALLPSDPTDPPAVASVFVPGQINDAEVEDLMYGEGVTGGIIAPENEGEIMVIVVDDSALASAGGTSGAWL